MAEYSVVGKSFPGPDSLDKVTGRSLYGVDVKLPGMLYGKILRSPYPHARIIKTDTDKARALSGVKAVLTAKEFAGGRYGVGIKDQTLFPQDRVRFAGDAVAAVAAVDEERAEEALSLISVEYQELPSVFDPEEAIKKSAPLVHEGLPSYWHLPHVNPIPGTNICNYFKLRKGDVAQGFRNSDLVLENTFKSQMVHHAYTEPHACLARFDPSGKVTVWTNTQAPYRVRQNLADALQIPLGSVRIIATKVGGGFGGKIPAELEPYAAALSMATGRPVKLVMTRAEEFIASTVRHPAVIKIKTGLKADGTFLACEIEVLWDTGAYSKHGPFVSRYAGYSASGPYKIPNVNIDSYCLYTNNVTAGAFRGFGLAQTGWALESQMDLVAKELGMDPLEFRLKNVLQEGDVSATGEVMHSVGAKECLEKAARSLGWTQNSGQGLALIYKFTAPFSSSCAYVKVNEDGSMGLMTSAMDVGQGSNTILAQIAAEELGVEPDQVALASPDTETTPYDYGTLSSRITFHTGNAVRMAAADAKEQLLRLAAEKLEASPSDLTIKKGRVHVRGSPERAISLAELAALSHTFKHGPVLGRGSFFSDDVILLDPETGQSAKPTEYWKYSAQAAQVEVDRETGEVHLLRLTASVDAGRAINPRNVQGQIEGAAVMGVGAALLEEMALDKGRVINPSFMDYNLPTALDAPKMEPIIVEVPHKDGPFGAKGVGEGGTPPTAPAVANAIANAVAVRIKELPITSEKVWKALKETS